VFRFERDCRLKLAFSNSARVRLADQRVTVLGAIPSTARLQHRRLCQAAYGWLALIFFEGRQPLLKSRFSALSVAYARLGFRVLRFCGFFLCCAIRGAFCRTLWFELRVISRAHRAAGQGFIRLSNSRKSRVKLRAQLRLAPVKTIGMITPREIV